MDNPSLLISFALEPGTSLLRATLPNGASFIVEPHEVHGKLGSNLDLFRRAVTPKSNDYNNVTVVAEGKAQGLNPLREPKVKRTKAKAREVEDILANLEIKL